MRDDIIQSISSTKDSLKNVHKDHRHDAKTKAKHYNLQDLVKDFSFKLFQLHVFMLGNH